MKLLCTFLTVFLISYTAFSQIKVGNNVGTISPASVLEIESTDQGVLLPRLTSAQRDAQGSWTEGHIIYNTTDSCFQFFDGNVWECLVKESDANADTATPSGIRYIGENECKPCKNTVNDIYTTPVIPLSSLDPHTDIDVDSTMTASYLDENKCFIALRVTPQLYTSAHLNIALPHPAPYVGKTFTFYFDVDPAANVGGITNLRFSKHSNYEVLHEVSRLDGVLVSYYVNTTNAIGQSTNVSPPNTQDTPYSLALTLLALDSNTWFPCLISTGVIVRD